MILVAGATGILGSMITRRLLDQGRQVRILARKHSDYRGLATAGADVAFGDLKERATLDPALRGVEVVVTTANSAMRGGPDNPQSVEVEGNRNLIDAARAAGVRQFIYVSAYGASLDSPSDFVRGKAQTEQYLQESGMPFTILAPNIFMEVWIGMIVGAPLQQGQPVSIVGEGRRKHSFVSMEDVAAFAVAAVDNPAAINRYIPVGGPAAVSWTEVVNTAGRVMGQPIAVQLVPPGEPLPGLPAVVSQLMAGQDTYDSPIEMSELCHRFGVSLTPVDSYVERMFASAPQL
jgi:uncharacterized protein YbjT (DUF2867 family)